jgi:hypothetical protein
MLKRAADLLRITAQTLALGDGDLETACPKCGNKLTLADTSVAERRERLSIGAASTMRSWRS